MNEITVSFSVQANISAGPNLTSEEKIALLNKVVGLCSFNDLRKWAETASHVTTLREALK